MASYQIKFETGPLKGVKAIMSLPSNTILGGTITIGKSTVVILRKLN